MRRNYATMTGDRRGVARCGAARRSERACDKIFTELSKPSLYTASFGLCSEMSTVRYQFMEKLGYETILALCRMSPIGAL